MVKPLCVVLAQIALICSTHALTLSAEDESARDAAVQWLQVIDSGNFDDAVAQISQEVQALRDWRNYFVIQRSRLGRANRRQIAEIKRGSTITGIPGVRTYKFIRFKTSFEHHPAATEEVTMMKTGCCWEVCDYKISDK